MTACWKLETTSLKPPGEPTFMDYAANILGGQARIIVDPDRYLNLISGFNLSASIWQENFRQTFCNTVPALELVAGIQPTGSAVSVASLTLVSASLRQLLEDAQCDAAYGAVTGDGLSQEAWFTLWVRSFADPVDHALTPGRHYEVLQPDGTTGMLWQRDLPRPGEWPVLTHYRADFTPPTPMVRSADTGWTLVTDALADRILRAGHAGIEFQDVLSLRGQTERILKTR